jgi:polar amino acid transport system ATP-binding protein
MAVAIEFRGVNKWFGEHHVLTDVDLKVDAGEVIVVCGPSGSGKSTLIRCVNRLEPVEKGEILVHGEPITGNGTNLVKLRTGVGMVFQSFNLFPHMTVLQNIMLAPRKVKGMGVAESEKIARTLLERVRIPDRADYYPANLSGGQQQRVAIARALAQEPRLIVADEPVASLDPTSAAGVLQLLRNIARSDGVAVICSLHQVGYARTFADRIIGLVQGRVIIDAKTSTLSDKDYHALYAPVTSPDVMMLPTGEHKK